MDDLVARLRACLDTDERVALGATPGPWQTWAGDNVIVEQSAGNHLVAEMVNCEEHPGLTKSDGEHIARNDPARVLRWVKAAREILGWYDEITKGMDLSGYDNFGSLKDLPADKSLAVTLAVEAVRALASVPS